MSYAADRHRVDRYVIRLIYDRVRCDAITPDMEVQIDRYRTKSRRRYAAIDRDYRISLIRPVVFHTVVYFIVDHRIA